MKTALITTTINVPHVLRLYRKLGPDVKFFVALDQNTDKSGIAAWRPDPLISWLTPAYQQEQWKCSAFIGWNNDSRRNIALLEAVKWGADIIVSVDDDMVPMGLDFFERFEIVMREPYNGLAFDTPGKWFDAGEFTIPPAPQRGLPPYCADKITFQIGIDLEIGAMQGIILGVPDTDAFTAMSKKPLVLTASDVLRHGFVVEPRAYSVFNSQLTAFRRELAPCFAQFYKWQGRNTDIFASLIMRRVMRGRALCTYFGPPFGFHARSQRDPMLDLKAEQYGVDNVEKLVAVLDSIEFSSGLSVVEQTRVIYAALEQEPWFDADNAKAAFAFLDDIEKVV